MAVDEGLIAWIAEATAPLGTLSRRAMMGGATLYLDGTAPVHYSDTDSR